MCNNPKLVAIWYGYPTISEIYLAREEKLVLGGPVEKEYTHYCYACNETYPFSETPFIGYN